MPRSSDLPYDLKPLVRRNALEMQWCTLQERLRATYSRVRAGFGRCEGLNGGRRSFWKLSGERRNGWRLNAASAKRKSDEAAPLRVMYHSSHRDEMSKEELHAHLAALRREGGTRNRAR